LNLVMEPPGGDEMKRPPVARDDALIGRDLLGRMAVMAPAAAAATFGWFWWRLGQGVALDLVRTETFTVLVMCQWFNVLNCRSATRSAIGSSLLRNPWLLGGLALSVALQLAVLYAPPLNAMFHTVPLAAADLLPMAAAASVVLWAEEARKAIVRRRR
jgi:Ca2+-transporting ATPase